MLELLKLEIKKYKPAGYLKIVLIANLVLTGLMFVVFYANKGKGDLSMISFDGIYAFIDKMVKVVFIVFAAILLARLFLDEYKNKTISVLFMYPVSRRTLLAVKLEIAVIFTFICIILSDIFIACVFLISNNFLKMVPGELTQTMIIKYLTDFLINTLLYTGASLIPLYFGMRKKSVPVTIVSALLVIAGSSLKSTYVMIFLAAAGIISACVAVGTAEDADICN